MEQLNAIKWEKTSTQFKCKKFCPSCMDSMKILLEAIQNNGHQRNICEGLKVTGILIGVYGVFAKI
jgi:hypothetical protein